MSVLRFSLRTAFAFFALAAVALTGCDTVGVSSETSFEAAPASPTAAPTEGKLRHAHLMDDARRTVAAARGGNPGAYISYIVKLDTYRILTRYGDISPQRILTRYQEMDPYRILTRYEYEDVFPGFAIWVEEALADSLLAVMQADDEVEWIEPDITLSTPQGSISYTAAGAEMTPWGVTRIGAGGLSGEGVDLFVIDTGVQNNDVTVGGGFDFVQGFATSGQDTDGHGTHIAGTAAGLANGFGVVGVAPGARVHDLRILTGHEVDDDSEVDLSRAIAAVEHATTYKMANPNRPVVVNFSLGADIGTSAYNALDEAIVASSAVGVTYVVAAGNDGIDAATVTPAHVAEAITVGAYDNADHFASFSNYGSALDVLAPGVDILSTSASSNDLALMSGTSMAAAYVSGAVAAFLAENPTATATQVEAALVETAQAGITGVPAGTASASVFVGGLMEATVPPFFQYAITAGNDVKGLTGRLAVRAAGSGVPNANVFANSKISLPLTGSSVEGFGYYGAVVSAPGVFQPAYNPAGLPATMQQPSIEIPAFRPQDYRHLATYVTGTTAVAGPVQLGTPENPAIIFVDGDLYVNGPTTVSGYGILLVTGSVYVNGSITTPMDGTTRLGLYAGGNVTFQAIGTRVDAQIFSAADVIFRAPTTLYGSVTAGGNVDVKSLGTVLHYRQAALELTEPFWPTSGR